MRQNTDPLYKTCLAPCLTPCLAPCLTPCLAPCLTLGGGSVCRWWGHLTTIGGNRNFLAAGGGDPKTKHKFVSPHFASCLTPCLAPCFAPVMLPVSPPVSLPVLLPVSPPVSLLVSPPHPILPHGGGDLKL